MDSKKTSGMKFIFHIYRFFLIIFLILIAIGTGLFLYVVKIQKPDGKAATSAWPSIFTEQFSGYIFLSEGIPQVNDGGIEQLQQYQLWLRMLDANGNEILLVDMTDKDNQNKEETIFAGNYVDGDTTWNYLIGFPLNVVKVNMYLNGDHFTKGKLIALPVLFVGVLFSLFVGVLYGLWSTRQMGNITKSIAAIESRTYIPVEETGVFEDVYTSLNHLDLEIRASDNMREHMEIQRQEWITNITHDLKTPLSPIKGYAELLADSQEINIDDIHKYAGVIQKNVKHVEHLINDLKLIYQMDNGMLPINKELVDVSRQLREMIIDLLNSPEYVDYHIDYTCDDGIYSRLDLSLFRRGITNVLVNAMVHNPPDTTISVSMAVQEEILICICDNGNGLTGEEQEHLFDRYYRGTNTEIRPEGTGLGMAIVKQIVELHGGKIAVHSVLGEGTSISIYLPCQN